MRCSLILGLLWSFTAQVFADNQTEEAIQYAAFTEQQLSIAQRTQRDIARSSPLISSWGVALNSMVFEPAGYTLLSIGEVQYLLDYGIQTFLLDLYWNEFNQQWQLCPAPFVAQNPPISGLQSITWNDVTYQCDADLTVNSLFQTFANFLVRTNTNLDANFLQILVNLKSITNVNAHVKNSTNSTFAYSGNSTLSDSFEPISAFLYTPSDLQQFQVSTNSTDFPSFADAVLKRATVNVVSNQLEEGIATYNFSMLDFNDVFFVDGFDSGLSLSISTLLKSTDDTSYYNDCLSLLAGPKLLPDFQELEMVNTFEYVIDNDDNQFDNDTFRNYIRCGISPILNATNYPSEVTPTDPDSPTVGWLQPSIATDFAMPSSVESVLPVYNSSNQVISEFILSSFWSWAPDQPNPPAENDTGPTSASDPGEELGDEGSPDQSNGVTNFAFQCVALYPDGWHVANCYQRYNYACQNSTEPNDWIIPFNTKKNYFEGYKDSCPTGYNFTLPTTPIENLSLMQKMNLVNATYPVWIDLNDITVSGCFVSGGPYAHCPYQRTFTGSKLIGMIAPSFFVAVFLFFLMIAEKFFVSPIQTNRKRTWKKKIVKYYEKNGDYEGVPS